MTTTPQMQCTEETHEYSRDRESGSLVLTRKVVKYVDAELSVAIGGELSFELGTGESGEDDPQACSITKITITTNDCHTGFIINFSQCHY